MRMIGELSTAIVAALVEGRDRDAREMIAALPASERERHEAAMVTAAVRRGEITVDEARSKLDLALSTAGGRPALDALLLAASLRMAMLTGQRGVCEALARRLDALLDGCSDLRLRARCVVMALADHRRAVTGYLDAEHMLDRCLGEVARGTSLFHDLQLKRAHNLIAGLRHDQALPILESLVNELRPDDPRRHDVKYLRAMALAHGPEAERSLDILKELEATHAMPAAWLLTQRVQVLARLNRCEEAEEAIDRFAGSGEAPSSAGTLDHLRSLVAISRRDYATARMQAERALRTCSQQHVGMAAKERRDWAILLMVHLSLCERKAAQAHRLLKAHDPERSNPNTAIAWCRLALLQGDWPAAVNHFRRAESLGEAALAESIRTAHEFTAYDLTQLQRATRDDRQSARRPAGTSGDGESARRQWVFHGESGAAREIRRRISQYADSMAPVLIEGETGTGKEVVARLLHESSPRRRHPFIAINCAGLTASLIESELFGHVKGAFTGAVQERKGMFEAAGMGTLFLDEIHATSPAFQASLLRVLETGEVRPVGSNATRQTRCRVLVAANRELAELVEAGEFREDLYYRVARLRFAIPPLRERRQDIPVLVRHFLEQIYEQFEVAVSPELMEYLRNCAWPGNVRQLRNEIERVSVLAGSRSTLDVDLVDETPGQPRVQRGTPDTTAMPAAVGRDTVVGADLNNPFSRRAVVREWLRTRNRVTIKELTLRLGCSPVTARKDLDALIAEGAAERINPTKSPRTLYFISTNRT